MAKRTPDLSRRAFQAALHRNGFKQVLLWITDTTGEVPHISWGILMHRGGKIARRATLAYVVKQRDIEIAKKETALHTLGCTCAKCDPEGVYA